jgi:arylsulfatase A-like enzyme
MFEGKPLVADAVRLIEAVDRPTFIWVHLMDPHGPYFPPDDYRRRFDPADYVWPGDAPLPLGTTNFGLHLIPAYQIVAAETDPARYRARYDAEIRYTDDHVSAIVAALRTRGLWDRTLFVLTADHGEALGEHDYWFAHGWFVSDDQLHVPLIVHGAGFPAGRRVGASVSLVDVAPTILEAVGLPPTPAMEGRSLDPLLAGDAADRDAFAQTYYGEGLVALRAGRLKYVFKPPLASPHQVRPASDPVLPAESMEWLFDLAADPGETTNLVATHPAVAALRTRLQAWLAQQEKIGRGKTAEQPRKDAAPMRVLGDPQLQRQLKALGYLD